MLKQTTLRLPEELLKEAKQAALDQGKSLQTFLQRLLESRLGRKENITPKRRPSKSLAQLFKAGERLASRWGETSVVEAIRYERHKK